MSIWSDITSNTLPNTGFLQKLSMKWRSALCPGTPAIARWEDGLQRDKNTYSTGEIEVEDRGNQAGRGQRPDLLRHLIHRHLAFGAEYGELAHAVGGAYAHGVLAGHFDARHFLHAPRIHIEQH